jgi:FtsP/CotA-like multicopper oxidase with cupredoxin domain
MSQHHEHDAHSSHEHHSHGHGAHAHGPFVHAPSSTATEDYQQAYEQAEPAPGGTVVRVEVEAREVDWEFTPGRTTRVWTFNGQVPGPFIAARVGDVLEVRLTNRLPEPTTLHWHGLRVPAAMDGTDMVQHPIATGETFTYRFKLLDAGTFWYHTHSNEPYQLERGLYGALVVRAADEPTFDRERVLVVSDVMLDGSGQVAAADDGHDRFGGREGNVRLVNGTSEPELMMWGGQVERWRIINAASSRYVRVSIGRLPFRVLGTGGGMLERATITRDVLLTPGDRIDVAVGPFEPGEAIAVLSEPYDRGMGERGAEVFATVRVGPAAPSRGSVFEWPRAITPLVDGAAAPTREVTFTERVDVHGDVTFLINGEQHYRADPVTVGELQVWDIVNASSIDHPFHLHGFFFQVLERNGTPPAYRSWEDTVNVPAGGRVRIAWMPDDRPGEWMYHCHILEHHAAGMMAHFAVVRPGDVGNHRRGYIGDDDHHATHPAG